MIVNLASRDAAGALVSLDYDTELGQALVHVLCGLELVTLRPPADEALDWYRHPFVHMGPGAPEETPLPARTGRGHAQA